MNRGSGATNSWGGGRGAGDMQNTPLGGSAWGHAPLVARYLWLLVNQSHQATHRGPWTCSLHAINQHCAIRAGVLCIAVNGKYILL